MRNAANVTVITATQYTGEEFSKADSTSTRRSWPTSCKTAFT